MAAKKRSKKKDRKPKEVKSENKEFLKKKVLSERKPIPEYDEGLLGFQNFGIWTNHKMQMLLVFVVSCLIYSNTVTHDYAVDDAIVITRNQFTKKGLKGMHGIWTEDTFVGFFGKKKNLVSGGRYRPLSVATFAFENQVFGSVVKDNQGKPILDKDGDLNYEGSPKMSHFFNILLYGLLCMVLYLLFLEMFNPKRDQNNLKGYFIALAGALLYATHPIHTEAVANIKGRDEIMVLLGSVLAVYWSLKSINQEAKKVIYMAAAVAAFVFGIFSKENALTFIAIIPAALYLFTKASPITILLRTLPFVLVVGIFWFGVRGVVLGNAGDTTQEFSELMNNPFLKVVKSNTLTEGTNIATEKSDYVFYNTSERYGTVIYTWLEYIKLLIFPHPLTNDYYPCQIRTAADGSTSIPTFQSPAVLLSILIHIFLGLLTLWGLLKRKPIAFCILFYAATFSVVSNLIFPIGTNMAERFMFLPSVGFCLACAMGLYAIGERINPYIREQPSIKGLSLPIGILAVVCILYSGKTFSRNFVWQNDYTLFMADIETSTNSAKLNNAVSGALQDMVLGCLSNCACQTRPSANCNRTCDYDKALCKSMINNPAKRQKIFEEARDRAVKAIKFHPSYNQAWLLYGNANVHLSSLLQDQFDPKRPETNGFLQKAKENYDEALKAYLKVKGDTIMLSATKAALISPDGIAGYLTKQGNQFVGQPGGPSTLNPGLRPDHPDAGQNLGVTFRDKGKLMGQKMGNINAALRTLEAARLYLPDDFEITRLLGVASGVAGQHQKAIQYFEEGLAKSPDNIAIIFNLEIAYRQLQFLHEQGGNAALSEQYKQKAEEYKQRWIAIDPEYKPTD